MEQYHRDAERNLDDRRIRLTIELALLGGRHDQQIALAHRAMNAPTLRAEVNALPHRRMTAIHLAQLEQNGIEEVVDDALTAPLPPESARRLSNDDTCRAHRHERRGAAALRDAKVSRRGQLPFALANESGREVLSQLASK